MTESWGRWTLICLSFGGDPAGDLRAAYAVERA
jgi:hypothetical protein